jgi:hypothetical protein
MWGWLRKPNRERNRELRVFPLFSRGDQSGK